MLADVSFSPQPTDTRARVMGFQDRNALKGKHSCSRALRARNKCIEARSMLSRLIDSVRHENKCHHFYITGLIIVATTRIPEYRGL